MTTVAGALTTADVADFLIANGVAVPASSGNRSLPQAVSFDGTMPKTPDRVLVIAMTGGPGLSVEGLFDTVSFQIRTRGKAAIGGRAAEAGLDAEQIAWSVDAFLLAVRGGVHVGSQFVNLIDRVGSPPTFLLREPGSGRVHMTGNYLFSVARA